jgi:hypothetical protein
MPHAWSSVAPPTSQAPQGRPPKLGAVLREHPKLRGALDLWASKHIGHRHIWPNELRPALGSRWLLALLGISGTRAFSRCDVWDLVSVGPTTVATTTWQGPRFPSKAVIPSRTIWYGSSDHLIATVFFFGPGATSPAATKGHYRSRLGLQVSQNLLIMMATCTYHRHNDLWQPYLCFS